MTLEELQTKISIKVNNSRSIQIMIQTPQFRSLWNDSSELERKRIETIVLGNNKEEVNIWIKHHPATELGELCIRRLRERAKRLKIKNYCRLMKFELIREIAKLMKEK